MKIAYLLPNLSISGGVSVVFQHANRLQKRGYKVCLVTLCGIEPTDWFPNQNVECCTLNTYPSDVDVLIATSWETAFYLNDMPATHKCYFVQSDETRFHPENSLPYYFTSLSYQLNYHFLTEAKWIQKFLLENYGKRAAYVPNGLDEQIFYHDKPLQPKGTRIRVLLEGAIDIPYKGMKESFLAINGLDVEVWCVSSFGEPKKGWKCDRFFEKVPMHKMRHIYSSCDILLKLSRVEGFFGPPLEMMACGGCCVVANVSGADEYIRHEYNALVIDDPCDIAAARAAVAKLIDNPQMRKQLITNGYETASSWNWDRSIDNLEKFIATTEGMPIDNVCTERLNNDISNFYKSIKEKQLHDAGLIYNTTPHEKIFNKLSQYKITRDIAAITYNAYKRIKIAKN